jgi:hypothetical protein
VTDTGSHSPTVRDISGDPKLHRVSVATTKLLLVTGDELEVDAPVDLVVKALEDATRSSAGTLARLTQAGTGEPIALNAAHVVAVRPGNP